MKKNIITSAAIKNDMFTRTAKLHYTSELDRFLNID